MAQESLTPTQAKEFMGYIGEHMQIENENRGGFRGGQQQGRGGRGGAEGGGDRGGDRGDRGGRGGRRPSGDGGDDF